MARIIDWGAAELAAACLSSDRGRRGIHCAPFSHLQSSSPWWRSTWRVLLASRAGGADATSQIGEYLNLSISQLHYSVESLDRVFPCLPYLRQFMNGPKRPRDEPPGAFCESNIATRRNQCTIVTNEPTTTQVRYKTLDKRQEV